MTIHVPADEPRRYPCDLAFVGEAPSDEEILEGRPLVGPTGRLFNGLLRSAGLDRRDALVTNLFDEKLPDNEVANWCVGVKEAEAGGFANSLPPIPNVGYLKPEYHWHLQRLSDELLKASPTVIVPLGDTALWAFVAGAISQMRGVPTLATRVAAGKKLLPTYHPAFLFHGKWSYWAVILGDIQRAAQEVQEGEGISFPHRELWVEPTVADLEAFLPFLLASDCVSVDIETGWGGIMCIAFAPDAERALCIPFADLRQLDRNYWRSGADELKAWQFVKRVMEDASIPKVGQNFTYDAYWLLKKAGIRTMGFVDDTRILHHALYPEMEKSLKFMGAAYTKQGAWKSWAAHNEKRDDA